MYRAIFLLRSRAHIIICILITTHGRSYFSHFLDFLQKCRLHIPIYPIVIEFLILLRSYAAISRSRLVGVAQSK